MPTHFTTRAVSASELDDLNTFLIALADDTDKPTSSLEFQKALEVDEDDADSDTYCLIVSGGATDYGGVSSCRLKDSLLTMQLNEHAASTLQTSGLEISLDLDQVEQLRLHESLHRLFSGDRSAPTDLPLG